MPPRPWPQSCSKAKLHYLRPTCDPWWMFAALQSQWLRHFNLFLRSAGNKRYEELLSRPQSQYQHFASMTCSMTDWADVISKVALILREMNILNVVIWDAIEVWWCFVFITISSFPGPGEMMHAFRDGACALSGKPWLSWPHRRSLRQRVTECGQMLSGLLERAQRCHRAPLKLSPFPSLIGITGYP